MQASLLTALKPPTLHYDRSILFPDTHCCLRSCPSSLPSQTAPYLLGNISRLSSGVWMPSGHFSIESLQVSEGKKSKKFRMCPEVLDQRYTVTDCLPIACDFDGDQTWHSKDSRWNSCAAPDLWSLSRGLVRYRSVLSLSRVLWPAGG